MSAHPSDSRGRVMYDVKYEARSMYVILWTKETVGGLRELCGLSWQAAR